MVGRRLGALAADVGTGIKIVTVGGLTCQSGVAGTNIALVVGSAVVVGAVVPDAFSTKVGGVKLRSGSTGASRSPVQAAIAKSIASRGVARIAGTVPIYIPGKGIPYER